jgi:tetratricopeptide (TPR) repeat protein
MRRAACVLLVTWLVTSRAYGAPAPAEGEMAARQHFRVGEAHYSGGQFAEALTDYEAGYASVPLPGFLVNIAQCHRRLGHLEEARRTYQKFVLVAPDSPLAPEVRGLIAELDKLLAPPATSAGGRAGQSAAGTWSTSTTPQGSVDLHAPPPFVPLLHKSTLTSGSSELDDDRATTRASHWWFWGAVAAAAVGGVIAIVALSPGNPNTIHDGSLATLRR